MPLKLKSLTWNTFYVIFTKHNIFKTLKSVSFLWNSSLWTDTCTCQGRQIIIRDPCFFPFETSTLQSFLFTIHEFVWLEVTFSGVGKSLCSDPVCEINKARFRTDLVLSISEQKWWHRFNLIIKVIKMKDKHDICLKLCRKPALI